MQEGYCADGVGLISVKSNSELSLLTYTKMLPTLLTPKKYTRVSCLTMVIAKLTYLFTINRTALFNFLQSILLFDFSPMSFLEDSEVNIKHLQKRGKIMMSIAHLT